MKIILLQGNFPEKYNGTRHNVAFAFGDFLAQKHGANWREVSKFKAKIAEISLSGEKILLVKPLTFYNETGFSARAICDFYKINFRKDFLAVCDDLDLEFGVMRARLNGSAGGNNGLKSLISTFGQDFARLRIGISNDLRGRIDSADFVLSKFSKIEAETLPKIFKIAEDFTQNFAQNHLQNEKKSIQQ